MLGLSWGMRDLVPQPGIKPRAPALRAQSLSHWTTRGVLNVEFQVNFFALLFHSDQEAL